MAPAADPSGRGAAGGGSEEGGGGDEVVGLGAHEVRDVPAHGPAARWRRSVCAYTRFRGGGGWRKGCSRRKGRGWRPGVECGWNDRSEALREKLEEIKGREQGLRMWEERATWGGGKVRGAKDVCASMPVCINRKTIRVVCVYVFGGRERGTGRREGARNGGRG